MFTEEDKLMLKNSFGKKVKFYDDTLLLAHSTWVIQISEQNNSVHLEGSMADETEGMVLATNESTFTMVGKRSRRELLSKAVRAIQTLRKVK